MSPEAPDLTDVEFRLRNARAGVALSVFCGLYLAAYCLATWAQPHRGTILAVAIGAIGGSLAMLAVPLRGILPSYAAAPGASSTRCASSTCAQR